MSGQLQRSFKALERVLAGIDAGRISRIDADIIRRIHDPDQCPEAFLPLLAWEYSVDEWDPSWPVGTKREVIKASYEVHRHKGTAYGLETAIKALQLGARVEEWFEYGGPAYRFRLRVDLRSDQPWSSADQSLMVRTALRTKNVRSRLEAVHLNHSQSGPASYLGAMVRISQTLRIVPDLPRAIGTRPYCFIGAGLRTHQSLYIATQN